MANGFARASEGGKAAVKEKLAAELKAAGIELEPKPEPEVEKAAEHEGGFQRFDGENDLSDEEVRHLRIAEVGGFDHHGDEDAYDYDPGSRYSPKSRDEGDQDDRARSGKDKNNELFELEDEMGIVCPANEPDDYVPPRQWWAEGWVPMKQITLLTGDGGDGKTLLALQLLMAGSEARNTLGMDIKPGRVLYIGAEDDYDEFKRRQLDICDELGLDYLKLYDFKLYSLSGENALMASPDKHKVMQPTELFEKVARYARLWKPVCIVWDTSANLYGGNEIDRGQVQQFVNILKRLAVELNGAGILLSHPSVAGMQSGAGTSGSTGWSNAVRARLYLTRPQGDNVDPDMRVLRNMKSNYGKKGQEIYFKWDRGAFVLSDKSKVEKPVGQMELLVAEKTFFACLETLTATEKSVREVKGVNYAPKIMAQMEAAKQANVSVYALEKAMARLQADGRIVLVEFKAPNGNLRKKFVVRKEAGKGDGKV